MSTAFSQWFDTVQVTRQEPSKEVLAQLIREVGARASLEGKEAVNLAWAFSKMQAQFHVAEVGQ